MINEELRSLVEERTAWVYNDLKAFLYIRMHGLQHQADDIGGGNISSAVVLFSYLSLLSKVYYLTVHPEKFDAETGEVNEVEAFTAFAKALKSEGIIQELPSNGKTLEIMWNGFRNHLAHRFTVEDGKSVLATVDFRIAESGEPLGLLQELELHCHDEIFRADENDRNWSVSGDSLHARLPELSKFVCAKLLYAAEIDKTLIRKVVG